MRQKLTTWMLLLLVLLAGCNSQTADRSGDSTMSVDASQWLLSAEPAGARDVIAVRESATNNEEIVIRGRIGGSANPWIEGRAAFSIVDPALKACNQIEGDTCSQPWDYCCETAMLPTATALVKFTDDRGTLINVDARELLQLTELQTVVIRGTAQRDDADNLTVLAQKIYVNR